MPKYVKSEKGYEKSFETDWKSIKLGLKKARAISKKSKSNRAVKKSNKTKT